MSIEQDNQNEQAMFAIGIGVLIAAVLIVVAVMGVTAHQVHGKADVDRTAAAVTWSELEPGSRAEMEHENCQQLAHRWVLTAPGGFDDQLTQKLFGHDVSALRAYVTELMHGQGCSFE